MSLLSSHFILLLCLLSGLAKCLFSAALFHSGLDLPSAQSTNPQLNSKNSHQHHHRYPELNRNSDKLHASTEENLPVLSSETFYAFDSNGNEEIGGNFHQSDENNDDQILSNDQPYPYKKRLPIISNKLSYTNEIYLKQGRIKGIVRNFQIQTGLRDVDQYLGIPYAEAPVGSRRFMPAGE